jgi:peptide-methionine (S)-S-oxide reductase
VRTRVGYAGGTKKNPTYHSLGDHTETIQIDFDPEKIPYERLLDIFWASHDPTSKSWSRQYKAVIFYHDEEQKNMAAATRDRLAAKLGTKIHTEILPYEGFYLAEPYHQKYRLRSARDMMAEFSAMYPLEDDFVNSTAAARVNGYLGGYGSPETVKS